MEKNKTKQDTRSRSAEEKNPVDGVASAEDGGEKIANTESRPEPAGVDKKTDAREEKKDERLREPSAQIDPGNEKFPNKLREFRIENMMSKAELARKAGLSVLTVARIENGYGCRMDTKRKILKALGLKLADRRKVFEDD